MPRNALQKAASEAAPPLPATRRQTGRLRTWHYFLLGAGVLVGLLAMSGAIGNEPLRRSMEAQINRRLHGYTMRIAKLRLQAIGGSLTLEGVEIRQIAHPEPPLAVIPLLKASVEWRQLFFLRLVADFMLERPSVSMNLAQLQGEVASGVPVQDRGWQQAVQAIYPLKINSLRIHDASLVYADNASDRPLRVTHLNVQASNIRNIHSREHAYPSPIEMDGTVFGSGRAALKGHADFLAEPHFGIQGQFRATSIPLDDLRPLGRHWNVETRKGSLSANGEVEYAPKVRRLHLPSVVLSGVQADYVRRPPGAPDPLRAAIERSAPSTATPSWDLSLDRLQLVDSNVGLRDETRAPAYRVFVSQAGLDVNGFSNRSSSRPATALLSGQFMGSGKTRGHVKFWPVDGVSDADLDLTIEATDMRTMNDLFRAHGKFDVAAGVFSLYSQLHLRGREVDGYVKPLFHSVEIYDSRQDADKSLFRKVYEGAVDAAAKILTNPKRKQVATTVEIHGPVSGPKSSTLQIVGGLVQNAFFKAVLPGFDQQIGVKKR